MNPQHTEAINVLMGFLTEMRQWELTCAKRRDDERAGIFAHDESVRASLLDLKVIFDKYCKYRKLTDTITFTDPPCHNPEKERVLEVTEGRRRLLITTERQSILPKTTIRYTLVRTPDGYRITDRPERLNEFEKKFVSWDLLL